MKTSPDAIVIVDQNGFIMFVSPPTYGLFAVPAAIQVIGSSVLEWITPEGKRDVVGLLQGLRKGEVTSGFVRDELLRHDRTTCWAEISSSPLKNVKAEIRGLLRICRDVCKRRNPELAPRQAQRMESIGVMSGGIAHDFDNLLQAILGQSHLALSKLPEDSDGRSNIERAERATDLTKQLLAYSVREI